MTPTKIGNVLSWGSDVEPGTIDQAQAAASLSFVRGHLALMPDAHIGAGSTIGSVIPTQGAIIPAAVGVDIGCGMIAVETDLTSDGLPDDLDRMLDYIAKVVPAGMGKAHNRGSDWDDERRMRRSPTYDGKVKLTSRQGLKIGTQFGTLGGGNHFIEISLDERDRVWVVLHSGSRGIGKELAEIHINKAKGLMKERLINLEDPSLAYLVEGEESFNDYIHDMLWAQDYAMGNRSRMMDVVLQQLWGFVGTSESSSEHGVGKEVQRINCHHNYTQREHHMGTNVWLTRKGAVRARLGDMAVIPGSMGTSSYIVSGLGNPASYDSCAHGAGRRMSRGQARRELTVEGFAEAMGDRTWQSADAKTLLDESPGAYKDIDVVMADQQDLVKVEHTLHQILNFKGA